MRALALAVAALAAPDDPVPKTAPRAPATCVAPAPGGGLFVARADAVALLDEATLETRRETRIEGMEKVLALALSPDGRRLAAVGGVPARLGDVALLDPSTLAVERRRESPLLGEIATSVAWTDDASAIVVGGSDRTARVVDPATLEGRRELRGHTGPVLAVAARGGLVATGSSDGTIRVWDLHSGELRRSLTNHAGPVNALAFEPAGRRLASGSDDRTVRIWDPETGRMMRIVREHAGRVLSVGWWPAGLWSGSSDGAARRVDADEGSIGETRVLGGGLAKRWVYSLTLVGKDLVAATDGGVGRIPPG